MAKRDPNSDGLDSESTTVTGEDSLLSDSESGDDLLPGIEFSDASEISNSLIADKDKPVPAEIGNYEPLSVLGQGGMGTVYLARQVHPIEREVALKVIKHGRDSDEIISRFETERQALALMNHRNIAQVFDGGVTKEGLPFFAMEFVDGMPLVEFCDHHHLPLEDRLHLFVQICKGIEHAHQKGVIHRDLKPSNILVVIEEGVPVPKIIDFGLAKATGPSGLSSDHTLTALGQMLGTVQYMSPEQAQLDSQDIDTRTDIYSLGVLLYELITGVTPVRASTAKGKGLVQILQWIQNKEPVRPSVQLEESKVGQDDGEDGISHARNASDRRVQNELDWVVMKCLEIDRDRRYSSASQLGVDLNNYLTHQPVAARPPSTLYRVSKFVQRNRGYAFLLAALILTLLGATVVSLTLAAKANIARSKSDLAKQRALDTVESVQRVVLESPVWQFNSPGRKELIQLLSKEYQFWADDSETGKSSTVPHLANNLVDLARKEFELGRRKVARRLAQFAMDTITTKGVAQGSFSQLVLADAEIILVETGAADALEEGFAGVIEMLGESQVDDLEPDRLAIKRCQVRQELADACFRRKIKYAFAVAYTNLEECERLIQSSPGNQEVLLLKARSLSRVGICRRQGIADYNHPAFKTLSSPVPLYDESIELAQELVRQGYRPLVTSQLLAGAVSNRGLNLLDSVSEEETIANYNVGLGICDELLSEYPNNLLFKEMKGLLLLNLAAVHDRYRKWELEERTREISDCLLEDVVADVGIEGKAGDRFGLNRLHLVVCKIRLGKEEEAKRIAQQIHQLELAERMPREFVQKLIFYRVMLTQLKSSLSETEIDAFQIQSDTNFKQVLSVFATTDRVWELLDTSQLFDEYRSPKWDELWNEAITRRQVARKQRELQPSD